MTPFWFSRRSLMAVPLAAALSRPARALAADQGFASFISSVRRDALAQGIRSTTVDSALRGAEYLPRVIELDRQQPERTMTLGGFLQKVVTPQKTADGRAEMTANWPLLMRIHQRFNVQPRYVVALWAVESTF